MASSNFKKLPAIDECDFYKHKIQRLQDKYERIWDILDKVDAAQSKNSQIHNFLKDVTEELNYTQRALSEMQVFLFREREENLRLSAENDTIKIENVKLNGELEMMTHMHIKSTSRSFRTTSPDEKDAVPHDPSQEALISEISSLRTQLLNIQVLHQNEVDVLLKDREVVAQERANDNVRHTKYITHLLASLNNSQENLKDAFKQFLFEHEKYEKDYEKWKEERTFLSQKILMQERDSTCLLNQCGRSGSGKCMQEKLETQEKLTFTYKQQCKLLQTELNKWRSQSLTTEKTYKEKIQKLTTELTIMKNRFEVLDRRRILEAEGFRTDVKSMKERIKEIGCNVSKINSQPPAAQKPIGNKGEDCDNIMVSASAQNALYRAIMLEKEVKILKKKIATISEDVTHSLYS